MRVGLVVPALTEGGGVPGVALFLLRTLARLEGASAILVSLASASDSNLGVQLRSPRSWLRGVQTRHASWNGFDFTEVGAVCCELEFQRYRPRRALARLLADCDVIQVVCGSAAWANAVLGLGKPVSLQVATRAIVERRRRDSIAHGFAGRWRKAMTSITNRLDDRALRRVDAIQAENPWMLDYARALNADRSVDLRYAPPGIDANVFVPPRFRDADRKPYILCVGRLDDPRKNANLLLEAYVLLPARLRERTDLIFAGSSGPPPAFWQRAEALGLRGNLKFVKHPEREALVELYQHSSVFVLPSDEEGFGMVLLEAMACGVPVISTRSGGPEGIIADGEDGFLVPRDDACTLAERLNHLLTDATANVTIGRKARNKIQARYTEDVAGRKFVDVWERLSRLRA